MFVNVAVNLHGIEKVNLLHEFKREKKHQVFEFKLETVVKFGNITLTTSIITTKTTTTIDSN